MLSRIGLSRIILQCVTKDKEALTPCVQFVRWRKRRWAPVNAKKMWYFHDKKWQEEDEKIELKKLNDHYSTYRRSL